MAAGLGWCRQVSAQDLINEHAELEVRATDLRERIREAGWGGGSLNQIRKLKEDLWKAEDRLREIEQTRAWQTQDEDLDE